MMTPRTPIFTALVASSSPKPELATLPCVFITTMLPASASESALCSIRLSPVWHHTVRAEPMMRGEGHTGRMPASIAPRRDMLSARRDWPAELP